MAASADQRDTTRTTSAIAAARKLRLRPTIAGVNFLDLNVIKVNVFAVGDLDTDNNGDGQTNFADLNIVNSFFFGPPGPSANGCN